MDRFLTGAVFALGLLWSGLSQSAMAQDFEGLTNPGVDVAYVEPKQAVFKPIYERLKRRKVLEELRAFLAPLKLGSKRISIKTEECGNTFDELRPPLPATICYEYIHLIEQYAPKDNAHGVTRSNAIAGAFVLVSLHEVARAIFEVLNVPVWGREADAADKLAAFVMLEFGKDLAWRTLTGTAYFFETSKRKWTGTDFSATDSPEEQRYYNFLCMAYGSDSMLFRDFVRPTLLRTPRGEGCAHEFNQVRDAFRVTIESHLDVKLLQRVRQIEWVKADAGRLDK